MVRLVRLEDLVEALLDGHPLSRRSHEQIRQDQRVQLVPARPVETNQRVDEASFIRVVLGTPV